MGFQSLGESEITNRIQRGDQEHTSAIDHCFVAGDLGQQATRELVHRVGSHRAQLVTMSLSSKFGSPSGWKRYPWRRFSKEEKMKVIASMELFWHWALVGGAAPDNFLGAYHHVADEMIYRDRNGGGES